MMIVMNSIRVTLHDARLIVVGSSRRWMPYRAFTTETARRRGGGDGGIEREREREREREGGREGGGREEEEGKGEDSLRLPRMMF